ncbi:MAG: 50S ribosomal protein L16 [Nitrososphaerota archaeon]
MKARNYRRTEGMPYTREEYIHGAPEPRVTKYTMGVYREDYTHELELVTLEELQIRDTALESARVAIGKALSAKLGENYFLELRSHPHIVLRENKMIFGAHADRLQEGMRRAFGKPIGRAARLEPGKPVFRVLVYENGVNAAKDALELASKKLPKSYRIFVKKLGELKTAST